MEILLCTARTGNSITADRAEQGTSAVAHSGTPTIAMLMTSQHLTDIHTFLEALYPVGSIYMNAVSDTNPATLLGFGTWAAFGAGRVPVGVDTTDEDFDEGGLTGGAKTHTLTTSEMPTHSHSGSSNSTGAHRHGWWWTNVYGGGGGSGPNSARSGTQINDLTTENGSHSHTFYDRDWETL